jgi:exopolysaccharide biosynthesis protein
LIELADLFISLGAINGVALDGGGSSVSYYDGRVISSPTCTDTITRICERNVTSITCAK